MDQLASLE
ncbi:hypothetical protein F383_36458 [Gossypium arboreum]|uniref:Uncharacterized protein n=1 Tax=Gossypium arboreum TaxID=29729 RepID=A0A0B0N9D3_GOSAR|nr:hypothetical protein F383_36458 [Gossypium arboreum]